MKAGTDRKYTAEFRDSAVKQVEGGRGIVTLCIGGGQGIAGTGDAELTHSTKSVSRIDEVDQ